MKSPQRTLASCMLNSSPFESILRKMFQIYFAKESFLSTAFWGYKPKHWHFISASFACTTRFLTVWGWFQFCYLLPVLRKWQESEIHFLTVSDNFTYIFLRRKVSRLKNDWVLGISIFCLESIVIAENNCTSKNDFFLSFYL